MFTEFDAKMDPPAPSLAPSRRNIHFVNESTSSNDDFNDNCDSAKIDHPAPSRTHSRRNIFKESKPSNENNDSIHNKLGVATKTEATFVLVLGLLLSLNSGFMNALCLSGMLSENGSRIQSVVSLTGAISKSSILLAEGYFSKFGFEVGLIFAYIGGACISGALNPQGIPYKLVPSIGPTFLLGSIFMIVSAIFSEINPDGYGLFYFAAVANGLQNGVTSTYTANLVRTSHLTGTCTDIGLISGQMMRGNWKNYWKFKVFVGLFTTFWIGSLAAYYSAAAFLSRSFWFSALLYLIIGLSHVTFVALTKKVSFVQACVGNWNWDKVLDRVADSMFKDDQGGALDKNMLLSLNADEIFDQLDTDGSGEIDCQELTLALEKLGMKIPEEMVEAMINVVDANGDGVIDKDEFRALVNIASVRAKRKSEKKKNGFLKPTDFRSFSLNRSINSHESLDIYEDTAESDSHKDLHINTNHKREKRKSRCMGNTNLTMSLDRKSFTSNGPIAEVSEDEEAETNLHSGRLPITLEEAFQEGKPIKEMNECIDIEANLQYVLPKTLKEAFQEGMSVNLPMIVTEAKHPFLIVSVNEAWKNVVGFESSEAISRSMSDFIQSPKSDHQGLNTAMDRLAAGAKYVECTTIHYHKDNIEIDCLLALGPIYDENTDKEEQNVTHYVGVMRRIGKLSYGFGGEEA